MSLAIVSLIVGRGQASTKGRPVDDAKVVSQSRSLPTRGRICVREILPSPALARPPVVIMVGRQRRGVALPHQEAETTSPCWT